ncbi:hypothetical protein Zmor_010472 [Zophobas morio]|uniref:Promethin n=1 Tax=Zophobas morio TaxID=2755281 RepID=A0AA38IRW7_9CUCU|nr:hypothetical protein Zmor_010472 [Zophobas morio]
MSIEVQILPDKVRTFAQGVRRLFLKWSVQRPVLSMTCVIVGTVTLLPLVTAATLMPMALLLTYTGVLASHGIFYVTYNVFIQGLLLAMVIVALFIISFAVATSVSVFHSYRIFRRSVSIKKKE